MAEDELTCSCCDEEEEEEEEQSPRVRMARIGAAAVLLVICIAVERTMAPALWVRLLMYLIPYAIAGYDVVGEAIEHIARGNPFDEDFLMTVATVGALLIGFSRTLACEYTFILAIPTMLGASAVKLLKFGGFTGMEVFLLLTGMIAAFVVSLFVIRAMLQYIRRHNFRIFGFYRIILGVVVLILAATGKLG